jgi:nucleoside-diphosphate-sugar epimerase
MWTEDTLDDLLTAPSQRLVRDMERVEGDILILGAGGKMGPSLALLAKKAVALSSCEKRIITVSRFTDPIAARLMEQNGIEAIPADLLEDGALDALPDAPNVIFMAGRKFGTDGQEALTWAMNAWLPALVAKRYRRSRIVVFSSGNIYPMVPVHSGGATEETAPGPVGEYGMSCLGRERMFEYGSIAYGTPVLLYRLNYAVDLRYGVLHDIASNILAGIPIQAATPSFNCIWQGDANEMALRSLLLARSPANRMNITGPETVSTRQAARVLGKHLGVEPVFAGEGQELAYLSNAAKAMEAFGYPSVSMETMLRWQAEWILQGGRALGKPTHFEERKGTF